ncbi:hypothetical protein EDC36_104228 [Tepidimonas ignava]|uniref:Uncharacterized protein n=1 Tax=Tepidimonas ignava TaxID=114249 RepID=A0A4R3LJU6_9BURK|nr:hypothetical protein EDC36_104228 [Tepidimonas ignava]TSE20271.1 hypothetical protein Tigna_01902 [Tepidimonas ignava]
MIISYIQFLSSPSQAYLTPAQTPRTKDDYGKGIFVITGGSVAQSDTATVAAFLDAYGNNATYGNKAVHYFFVNVGTQDMALYRFQDDTGADNRVVADELQPVAIFAGVRTESLTELDLIKSLY